MEILLNGHRTEQADDWWQGLKVPHAALETVPQNVTLRDVEMDRGEVKVTLVHDIHVTDENKMVALKASFALALVAVCSCVLVVTVLALSQ